MSWLWGSSAPAYGEASGAVKALVEENEDLTRRLEAAESRLQELGVATENDKSTEQKSPAAVSPRKTEMARLSEENTALKQSVAQLESTVGNQRRIINTLVEPLRQIKTFSTAALEQYLRNEALFEANTADVRRQIDSLKQSSPLAQTATPSTSQAPAKSQPQPSVHSLAPSPVPVQPAAGPSAPPAPREAPAAVPIVPHVPEQPAAAHAPGQTAAARQAQPPAPTASSPSNAQQPRMASGTAAAAPKQVQKQNERPQPDTSPKQLIDSKSPLSRDNHAEYPRRFVVPDARVEWNVAFSEYQPVEFTADEVLQNDHTAAPEGWADPTDVSRVDFNSRPSYEGQIKLGKDGRPLNPYGRTGMVGRGLLGKWGPNHIIDPIITRWKAADGALQMLAQQQDDSLEWGIPESVVEPGLQDLNGVIMPLLPIADTAAMQQIFSACEHQSDIYRGYVDDPRNTDNSWIETQSVHFHLDDTGSKFFEEQLVSGIVWIDVGDDAARQKLCAGHRQLVEAAANSLVETN